MSAEARARLRTIKGVVLDLDGTLALVDAAGAYRALPGARDLLSYLNTRALPYVVLTNGTAHPIPDYVRRLKAAGLDISPTQMMTPSSVAADYFTARNTKRIMVLGVDGVRQPLIDAGLDVVEPRKDANADAVLVGWHPDFNIPDLACAADAIWGGASLYVTSDAAFFATAQGRSIGVSGAIAAAITSTTGAAATVLGKPAQIALDACCKRLAVEARDVIVIGDDVRLEPPMAKAGGAFSILVRTGLGMHASDTDSADWTIQGLGEVSTLLG